MLSLPAQIVAFKQLLNALDSNAKCWECFGSVGPWCRTTFLARSTFPLLDRCTLVLGLVER